MRLILSRKGFDSGTGRKPNPILPDGTLVPLPIPDRRSPVRYQDIRVAGQSLGTLVPRLTNGRVRSHYGAHLDPDLDPEAQARPRGWRPAFGQAGTAQRVLANHAVGIGDVFLFFGWFRRVEATPEGFRYVKGAPHLHVLFGWLQVGAVIAVGDGADLSWAPRHPHVAVPDREHNTLYVAAPALTLNGASTDLPGAGAFPRYQTALQLTEPGKSRRFWRLPRWFHPGPNKTPLGYHARPERWERRGDYTHLESVGRGQDFVLHTAEYPEAIPWIRSIIQTGLNACLS